MVSFKSLAVMLFGWVADKYGNTFALVRDSLPKADIKIAFRVYLSVICLISVIAYVCAFVGLWFVLRIIEVSFIMKVALFTLVPMMAGFLGAIALIFYPYQKANSRRKNMETNLPFVLTHMGAVAESGVPPYVIFRLIAKFEEYGEISKEMKKIVQNIENFGINPIRAVKEVAERTPSDEFKQTLMGFVTTTESGGDVKLYLKNAGQQALFEWRIRRERFLQQLSAYAEIYTGIFIAAPLFIIALFSVMNMISTEMGGYSILFLTKVSINVLIPLLNIGFLIFLRGMEVEM